MSVLDELVDRIPFALPDWPGPLALVGGSLRDALLGRVRPTLDLDFVAPGPIVERAKALARKLKAGFALLDPEHEIARLVLPDVTLDFARSQGNLQEDLARRDFTINALAYDLHARTLIDPLKGQTDLGARCLRAISEANLQEDPLRVLRGYRLAAQLDLNIEPVTRAMLVTAAPLLSQVSGERVREELTALIAAPEGADWLLAAYRDGALAHWLPELAAMEAIGASGYHHLPLVEHTFEVVRQVDRVVACQSELLQQDMDRAVTGTRSVRTLVKWAALLHDIAKPATWKFDAETGKTSFTDHENRGAAMGQLVLQRLKFSRDEERWVTALIKHHLRPGALSAHLPPSDRAVFRLCRDLGEMLPALLMLGLADRHSTLGPPVRKSDLERFDALVALLLGRYYAPDDPLAHPAALLDGHALMDELGLKPGPEVGRLLANLQEAQAVGEVATREEALALARRLIAAS